MDTKDINISKSEEEALKIMEDTSSVTSGQIQSLKEDEECMQICSDMAELAIEMRKAKNTLAIDTQKELADFHRKHSENNKHRKNTFLFWISFAGVAANGYRYIGFAWDVIFIGTGTYSSLSGKSFRSGSHFAGRR